MEKTPGQRDLQAWWQSSPLTGANAVWLEQLYEQYLEDPAAIDSEWRRYFDRLPRRDGITREVSHAALRARRDSGLRRPADEPEPRRPVAGTMAESARPGAERQAFQVRQLIDAYRGLGHLVADIDPLSLREIPAVPELDPRYHGLDVSTMDCRFDSGIAGIEAPLPLRDIIAGLRRIYCGRLASEYVHVADNEERQWIRERLESGFTGFAQPPESRRHLLSRITAAEVLERYLHTRYVGQKRFSLEGAETLVPMLETLIHRGGAQGIREVVIGMAHRGRLNVLINIMGKSPADLFLEFEGKTARDGEGSGDVKYHMGFSSNIETAGGPVHVALAFNPSHLEIVGPVVEGSVRARQQRRNDRDGNEVAAILIHGDAAFSGQGVLMETFNMSQSRGYSTKGTIHIVVNNQIGFTTSNQKDARSTLYCTDVAKMVNALIMHVNGDDPEAVLEAAQIALDYRMRFHKDVVIDLVCYRRHGHSEADEPAVTQPLMYQRIRGMATVRETYAARLAEDGVIDAGTAAAMIDDYRATLEAGRPVVTGLLGNDSVVVQGAVDWSPYLHGVCTADIDTTLPIEVIRDLTDRLGRLPAGFELHPSVARVFDNRRKMAAGALPVDWGCAEILAYASLVDRGHGVRLSGQDCARGTFFHRHAVVWCQQDDSAWVPLRNLSSTQGNFLVTNSLLSEEAVLAFEYGYSTTDPNTLVIWEAQFGDFANNAQVVIDQFISAGEQKWSRHSGLVMLLPHGFEGQGPEHSSARVERYLQLCAEHNMQVMVPTTPAQIFHLLRRQMLMDCRKPLVVMTPKSLLRHKLAVSTLEDLAAGAYRRVIGEIDALDPAAVTRVVLCCGKVYYDLLERRREDQRHDVALVRLEQLYPFPYRELRDLLDRYTAATEFIWCQEEPKNQGPWYPMRHKLQAATGDSELYYAGRPPSAAPAVGYPLLHVRQLRTLIEDAFGPIDRLR